jgi:hypothetical protein
MRQSRKTPDVHALHAQHKGAVHTHTRTDEEREMKREREREILSKARLKPKP